VCPRAESTGRKQIISGKIFRCTPVLQGRPRERASVQRSHQRDDENSDDQYNQEIAVGKVARACREVLFDLSRSLRQPGKIFIAQLSDGLVDFLIVNLGGLEGLLRRL